MRLGGVRVWGLRPGIIVDVTTADRDRLEGIIADRNRPQKHVWRAAIVLASADGLGTIAIMHRTGKSKALLSRPANACLESCRPVFRNDAHGIAAPNDVATDPRVEPDGDNDSVAN